MRREIKCVICRQIQKDPARLEVHFKSHDLSEIQRFSCHLCELKFLKFSSLEKHLRNVHMEKNLGDCNKSSYELRSFRQEVRNLLDGIIKEEEENLEFNCDDNSQDDAIEVDKNVDPFDNKSKTKPKKKKKIYKCAIEGCSKTFRHLTSFKMHGRCIHSNERSFTCEICSKSFKTRSNLNVHIKMHNNQRDHHCTICTQSFFTTSHLKAHVKIHLKDESYKCELPECGKTFIHLSSYKKHQAFHSGIKNHQCAVCLRNFSQVCHLREHLKIHSNERNHVCGQCNKAFRRPDTLRIHLKTHES